MLVALVELRWTRVKAVCRLHSTRAPVLQDLVCLAGSTDTVVPVLALYFMSCATLFPFQVRTNTRNLNRYLIFRASISETVRTITVDVVEERLYKSGFTGRR
jgi:hypothetical protein